MSRHRTFGFRDQGQNGALYAYRNSLSRVRDVSSSGGLGVRRILPVVIYVLFVLSLLVALIVGASTYQHVQDVKSSTDDNRTALALLANYVRAGDVAGAVGQGKGPEGKSLVLTETSDAGSYETRIYLYQGKIMQEYAIAGSPYDPARAAEVVSSQTFDFSYADSGLLTIVCDQGTTQVALRSSQGGA